MKQLAWCWSAVFLLISACFSPQFEDNKIQCGPNQMCPPGFECVANVCRSTSGGKDAGDSMAPAAPMLTSVVPTSPANNNVPRIIGSAEAMSIITLYTDAACSSSSAGTGTAESLASPGIAVNVNDDTSTTFYAKAKDSAGNASACSTGLIYVEDSAPPTAPMITQTIPASPSRSAMPKVQGTASDAVTVTLYSNAQCSGTPLGTGPVNAGMFDITVTVPSGQVTNIYATSTDAAGNVSPCSVTPQYYEQNAAAVGIPQFSGTSPTSPNNTSMMPTISGTTGEAGLTVRLYTDPGCGGTVAGMGSATGTTGAFSIMVTVAPNTTTTFYGQSQDTGVGTYSACSAQSIVYTHDSIAPAAPTVSGSTPLSPSNNVLPSITGTGEVGATVQLFPTADCSGAMSASGVVSALGTYSIPVMVMAPTTFHAKAVDPAGNTSGCSVSSFLYDFDNAAPLKPSFIGTNPGTPSTTNNTPIVLGTAENNCTIKLYRTGDCSGAVLATGNSGSTGTFGIGVTLPTNTTSQITATATDPAGNTSLCSSLLTYTHDSLPPVTPTITMSTPTSPTNQTSVTMSGTTEAGAAVRLYTDATCSTQIGNTVTANSGGAFSSAITISANTQYSIYARATDVPGNQSDCSDGFSVVQDSVAPGAPSLTAPPASATITTPTLTGTAEPSSTIAIYASQTCAGTATASGTANGTGAFSIMVTVGANSTSYFSAKATDAAGNTSPCSSFVTYIHDNVLPAAPTGLGSTPTSPSSSNTPTITGNAETGTTVRLFTNPTCSSAVAGTATAASGNTFSISLSVPSGSTTTFYATSTDVANNASPCSSSFVTYTEDSLPPTAPSALATTPASPSSNQMPAVTGNAEAGSTVKIYTNSGCTGSPAASGAAGGGGTFSINVTVGANATTTLWANATDAAGNTSPCSSSGVSYLHDNVAPGNPAVSGSTPSSPANNNAPVINGTAEAGATVRIYTASDCSTGLVGANSANGLGNFSVNVSSVNDNTTTTYYARAFDAAGNMSACVLGLTYVEDSTVPATPSNVNTNPPSPGNVTNPAVTGNAEANSAMTVYAGSCGGTVAGTGTATAGGTFSVAIAVASNSTTQLYVRSTDAAGNQSSCSGVVTYVQDSIAPSVPVLTSVTPASPANNNNPTVNGTAEASSTVKIYKTAGCSNLVGSGVATGGNFAIAISVLDNTTTTFYATATDAAGNPSSCTATGITYIEDSAPPTNPSGLSTTPPSGANNNFPTVNGSTEANATVRIYIDGLCATQIGVGSANGSGGFGITITTPVADNSMNTFYVRAFDAANNGTTCAAAGTTVAYNENSAAVDVPTLTSTTPGSPSNSITNPTVNGTSIASYTIKIYTTSNCTGTFFSGTVAANGQFAIATSGLGTNTTTTFYATATDLATNVSACSSGLSYTHDSSPPGAPTGLATTPASPSSVNQPTVTGTAEAGSTVRLYTNATCSSFSIGTGTASGVGGAFSITVTPGALADNSNNTLYANAQDAAGNTSTCSSGVSYIEDSAAPGLPTVSTTTPASPSSSSTSPTINGTAEPSSTVKVYPTSDCSGAPAGSGAANAVSGAFNVSVTVNANTTTTFKATATDAAGNTSPCSSTSVTYTHDSVAPAAPTNLATSPGSPANQNSPSITGNAETGSTVTIYTNSTCTSSVAGTGTALSGAFSISVSVSDNSNTTFYAKSTDVAGNGSLCSAGVAYVEDSAAPAPPAFTGTTPASPSKTSTTPTINGTAESGATVQLWSNGTCNGGMLTSQVAAGGTFAIPVTVTANATTTFSAKAVDTANNSSGCTTTTISYTHDNVAPPVPTLTSTTPGSPANNNAPTVNGTGEVGATISLYTAAACSSVVTTGTVAADGTFHITLNVTDNTTVSIYARATDAATNPSACTTTALAYIEDSAAPSSPTLTSINPPSPANANSPTVTGTTSESGATIKLYNNSSCTGASIGNGTSGAGGVFNVAISVTDNTTTTIYGTAADVTGNTSACSTSTLTYVEDSAPPSPPTNLNTSPGSPANNNTPTVTGTTDAGTTVRVYYDSLCSNLVGTATTMGTSFSLVVNVSDDTSYNFFARATDAAGNPSTCSTSSAPYDEDSTANPPTLTGTSPTSPSNATTTPTILGFAETDAVTVSLYTDPNCTSRVATGGIAADGSFAITASVSPNTATAFWANMTDKANNTSACTSDKITFISDTAPPQFNIPPIFSAAATATDKITVTWSGASDNFTPASSIIYQVCASLQPGNCSSYAYTSAAGASSMQITGLVQGMRYWFRVRPVDQAGNIGPPGYEFTAKTFGMGAATQISAGYINSCARMSDGTLQCWGENRYGQLGDGTTTTRMVPTPVTGLVDVVQVSVGGGNVSGGGHTCAVKSDGTVWCWGFNLFGQLGNGTTNNSSVPVQVSGLTNVVSVATGGPHTCAVTSSGQIYCWGYNGVYGLLGNNSTTNSLVPVLVSGINNAISVDLGYYHGCALLGDGGVKCWGDRGNSGDRASGKLGDGAATGSSLVPIAVSLGVNNKVKQLDVGGYHSCVVLFDGRAMCWGGNATGQLGNGTFTDATTPQIVMLPGGVTQLNVTAISAGGDYIASPSSAAGTTCLRLSTGLVRCFGSNNHGQIGNGTTTNQPNPVDVIGSSLSSKLSVGAEHSCYIAGDGLIRCWGNGASGRLGNNSTSDAVTQVAVQNLYGVESGVQASGGYSFTQCARLSNGQVWCWGINNYGQIGNNVTIPAPDVGAPSTPVKLSDGSFLNNVIDVQVAAQHICALRANGTVWCWGYNGFGNLGEGACCTSRSYAAQVSGINTAIAITSGQQYSCALVADGTVWCWGYNGVYQLGDGTTINRNAPVQVLGGVNQVMGITAQNTTTCAVQVGGNVMCWGSNINGNCGDGTLNSPKSTPGSVGGVSGAYQLASTRGSTCALIAGGTARCWGYGTEGQMGNMTNNTSNTSAQVVNGADYIRLVGGEYHMCAIKGGGLPRCWGRGAHGALGTGNVSNQNLPVAVTGVDTTMDLGLGSDRSCAMHSDGLLDCWGFGASGACGDRDTTVHDVLAPTAVQYFP